MVSAQGPRSCCSHTRKRTRRIYKCMARTGPAVSDVLVQDLLSVMSSALVVQCTLSKNALFVFLPHRVAEPLHESRNSSPITSPAVSLSPFSTTLSGRAKKAPFWGLVYGINKMTYVDVGWHLLSLVHSVSRSLSVQRVNWNGVDSTRLIEAYTYGT